MSDDIDPIEAVRIARAQAAAWRELQPYIREIREPNHVLLIGVRATHLRGFDVTRKLCSLNS